MTNIVMAYNAGQLQKSIDAAVAAGADLAACLRALQRVGPVSYGHINFRGTYFFPVERYAAHFAGGGVKDGDPARGVGSMIVVPTAL